VSYRRIPREQVIEEMSARLTDELAQAGADDSTIKIADIEETAVSYMADESTRIRIKMVGDLSFGRDGGN
ncbi:MAG: hydantoinase/oxoprolinase family protein, partial [Woeseiaceae bacterium]